MKRLYAQLDIDKNISEKIPLKLQRIVLKLLKNSKALFGNKLASVVIYGSVASGEYIHRSSDINVIILLNNIDIDILNKSKRFIKWCLRHSVNILLLTPEYIKSSLDTFGLEFFDIKLNHICLFGTDCFEDMNIDLNNLRLQCEHELKGKFLKLRQLYLEDKTPLDVLLFDVFVSLMPVFKGLVKIKGKDARLREETVEYLCQEYNLSKNVFFDIMKLMAKTKLPSNEELVLLFDAFLMLLERLINQVDTLTICK